MRDFSIMTDESMITISFIPPTGNHVSVRIDPDLMRKLAEHGVLAADYLDKRKELMTREGVQTERRKNSHVHQQES